MSEMVRYFIIFVTFAVVMYALMAVDFGKFIHKGRTFQAQLLLILLSMAITYLVVQFLSQLPLFF